MGLFLTKFSVVNATAIKGEALSTHICDMMSATELDAQKGPFGLFLYLLKNLPIKRNQVKIIPRLAIKANDTSFKVSQFVRLQEGESMGFMRILKYV